MACSVSSCNNGDIGSNPRSMINNCDLSFCGPYNKEHILSTFSELPNTP